MKKFFYIFTALVTASGMSACYNDDDDPVCIDVENPHVNDPNTYYGVNYPIRLVSKYIFDADIPGKGWKNVSEHEINIKTGEVDPLDTWHRGEDVPSHGMIGGGPIDFEIGKDGVLTRYFHFDAGPADCFIKRPYVYDEATNAVFIVDKDGKTTTDFPLMIIVEFNGRQLTTIEHTGERSDTPAYSIIRYDLCSNKMLEDIRKTHSTNFDEYYTSFWSIGVR